MRVRIRKNRDYPNLCDWQPETYKTNPKMKNRWYRIRLDNVLPEESRKKLTGILTKMRQGERVILEVEYDKIQKKMKITEEIQEPKIFTDRTTIFSLIHQMNRERRDEIEKMIEVKYPVRGSYKIIIQRISKSLADFEAE